MDNKEKTSKTEGLNAKDSATKQPPVAASSTTNATLHPTSTASKSFLTPAPKLSNILFLPDTMPLPRRSSMSVSSALPLTALPSKPSVAGGLAVSRKPSISQPQPSQTELVTEPPNEPPAPNDEPTPTDEAAATETFEVKMPRTSKSKTAFGGNVNINPRTIGSLVNALKGIYGKDFKNTRKRKHKKHAKDDAEEEAEDDNDLMDGKKKNELNENSAERLASRLYGDPTVIVDRFLEARRDCERELVFKEATFPLWVTCLWKVHLIYEFFTSCLLILSVFYGSYAAVFRNHSTDYDLLGIVNLIVAVDVIVRLIVEIWRSVTKCQYEVFTVNYTFFLALMDLLALLPCAYVYLLYIDIDDLNSVMYVSVFELGRIFHCVRMVKILDKLKADMNIGGHAEMLLFLTRYIIQYLFIVHLLSCIMFGIGQKKYMEWLLNRDPESVQAKQYVSFLTIRFNLPEPDPEFYLPYPEPFGLYSLALYFVVATISTVGFGDMFPTNNKERLLVILMMMIGAIWISGELAYQLGTFFTDLDASRYMMFFRVNCIKIHLRNYYLSDFVCKRTENYYKHLWRYRKGVHEIDLTYLPHCVQEEIKFDICEEMFFKSSMFRGLDETFLMGLAKSVKVSLYSPKMILFERGSITKQMCFILQGEVAITAGLNDDNISAILRAGCLIGEINLFMALPYEQTVYTNSVCTIMTLTKKDLMLSLQDNPHVFSILRHRMRNRRERFRNAFSLVNAHPCVQWLKINNMDDIRCDPEFPVKINRMDGWNTPVTGSPFEHEDEQVIIEMPCTRDDLRRIEVQAYRLVSVPQIFYDPGFLGSAFNVFTLGLWIYICWITPACVAFDDFEDTYFSGCQFVSIYWPFTVAVCIIDLLVELFTACPSTGRYYKIRDGIEVRKTSLGFYCDILSILPLELLYPYWPSSLFRMVMKWWKIGRFWDFLDERVALKLFFIRIAKMTYYLLYLTFLIGLFLMCLVCEPGRGKPCNKVSFYNPIYPKSRWDRVTSAENFEQYIFATPIVFATSTLTSVGFGNVVPQTTKEMMWEVVFMIIGHFFVSYILAQLTSALAARLTPKLLFHQKLLVVETFIRHNGLSRKLLRKLIEHYDLQHQYVSGCSLPEGTHLMYDGHKVLLEDVFLVEGEIFFDGVPAFAKIPSQAIIDMSRLMRRFVVPPDLMFVQRGEVRRELYVIVKGSVALYQDGDKKASSILRSTGHFGQRDLLFGEPYPYKVKTLSYVVLYAVSYAVFQEVLGDDEGLTEFIKDELIRRESEIKENLNRRIIDEDGPSEREVAPPSWISFPKDPNVPIIRCDLTYDHFEKPFLYHKGADFIRDITMPDTIHPSGKFGTMWQALMGLAAVANLVFLVIESFMGYRGPPFRVAQFFLDLLFCADIYIKCHWAYYDYREGALRYHPLKTWMRYVFKGSYFFEVGMMLPLELILAFSGSTDLMGWGPGHSWYTKLRWIRFLRSLRFIELYVIVHRIFENRTTVMFLFYLSITFLMSTILGASAYYFACPTFGYTWQDGDQFKVPVCEIGTWVFYKTEEQKSLKNRYKPVPGGPPLPESFVDELFYPKSMFERFVFGLYYVGQVLMVIGFGDQAVFRTTELQFLTSVALFGFIVCQAIVSDITSAQIDTDEIRSQNRESLDRIAIALSREGAPRFFTHYVRAAFRLYWSYARGLQPNDLFADLHPVLHRELLQEYIGDVFDRVPIFLGFTDAFVNALKTKLRIEFFPKGGLITRAGDLDYCMYIVVKGDVWVCDKDDRWLCTLSTGESVGEMSLVYSAKRRYSAYTATNTQVLVLKALDFASVLELFPLLRKQILKSLLNYRRDSYLIKAWKLRSKEPEMYLRTQEENTKLLKSFSLQNFLRIPLGGNVKLTEREKYVKEPNFFRRIVGYGSSETFSHYFYFASDDGRFNPVIHPSCRFILHFKALIQVVRFLSPIVSLFHVSFYVNDTLDVDVTYWSIRLGSLLDSLLWVNIVLQLFTAIEVSEKKTYCKSLGKIMAHYLLRPSQFLYDLLVAFPYNHVTGFEGNKLMLFRCLLSIKFFSDLWKLNDDIEVSTLQFKLCTSISFLLYLAHILACLFFLTSCGQDFTFQSCRLNGWVYKFRIEFGKIYGLGAKPPATSENDIKELYNDHRPSHWYFISLYWVMTVLTTVGFGEITPTSFEEILLGVFCIFFGSLFLSIMLGNITSGLSSMNKSKIQFLGKVEKMLDYLKVIGLSKVAHKTLSAYCNTTWNSCRGVNYNEIANILPLYVQRDVYLALYHTCITQCLFFGKDYDLSFLRAVCSRVRHYMFLPGMRIANELEPGLGIYIVMRGAVASFQTNPVSGNYEFIKRYEEFMAFGRIPGLYPGALYNKSYRAEEKTEVLIMYHSDIRQLISKYPKWKIFLKEMISREYAYFSRKTSLKDITERRLYKRERLTKDLTLDQFKVAANMFTALPPDRKGTFSEEAQHQRASFHNWKDGEVDIDQTYEENPTIVDDQDELDTINAQMRASMVSAPRPSRMFETRASRPSVTRLIPLVTRTSAPNDPRTSASRFSRTSAPPRASNSRLSAPREERRLTSDGRHRLGQGSINKLAED